MLVETTTVEQLIDRLKKGKYRSSQEILAKSTLLILLVILAPPLHMLHRTVVQVANVDDDIIADRQKMSLKCPVCRYLPLARHYLTCLGS